MADAFRKCAAAIGADIGHPPFRIVGCDLGKATAKFVVGTLAADGQFALESVDKSTHEGKPIEAFCRWYEERGIAGCAALGATGLYAKELAEPVCSALPTDACLAAALPIEFDRDGPLNLVSFGARGYRVLSRKEDGRVRQRSLDSEAERPRPASDCRTGVAAVRVHG